MIAALPMYDFAETKAAHVAFWAIVRDHLRDHGVRAPQSLDDTRSLHDIWSADDLVLSHICNLPYRQTYKDRLRRIGASDYGLEGCGPGQYRALFVVRNDHPAQTPEDLAGADMALNASDSHSGWGDAANWAVARGVRFRPVVWTASHRNSAHAVYGGDADFCTIDAWTYQLLSRIEPISRELKVIGATKPSPGMTFVTSGDNDPAPFKAALQAGLDNLEPRHRDWFGLKDIIELPDAAYDIPLPPDPQDWQT